MATTNAKSLMGGGEIGIGAVRETMLPFHTQLGLMGSFRFIFVVVVVVFLFCFLFFVVFLVFAFCLFCFLYS